jgi:hypothetical protein
MMRNMARQLHLTVDNELDDEASRRFRLDARTKAIGRRGLAKARAALALGRTQVSDERDTPPASSSNTRRQRKAA